MTTESAIDAHVLLVAAQKGGVQKTTVAGALGGHISAMPGQKVLLVDPDQQGSLTISDLGVKGDGGRSLATLMQYGVEDPQDISVMPTGRPDLDILSGGVHLAAVPMAVTGAAMTAGYASGSDMLAANLAAGLQALVEREGYTMIILDAGPGDVVILDALLKVAHYLLIPTREDAGSIMGVQQLGNRFTAIQRQGYPIELLGVVMVQINPQATVRNAATARQIDQLFGGGDSDEPTGAVFNTMIRFAAAAAKDIRDFHLLPHELLSHHNGVRVVGNDTAEGAVGRMWSRDVKKLVNDYDELGNEVVARLAEAYEESEN